MKNLLRLLPLTFALSFGTFVAGCGSSATLVPNVAEIKSGGVRIGLDAVDGDIVKLVVFNETAAPLRLYRDRVTLQTSRGVRSRLPGGVGGLYDVAPQSSHKLNVRFQLDDLPKGETVELQFNDAILSGDNAIPFEPMPFVVE